ncbi:MAG: response regulator [Acidobacteriota bacterium]|nr:response regulator [Acidobacteriota bacterium]
MPARILIADDYEDNRELLRLILVTADYEVLEARDGQQCVELARMHLPDLIMVDLSMPKLDGWEVFRILKADLLTREIPCIAVTAYAEIDRARALAVGFKDYLVKPFRTGELLETVDRLLAGGNVKSVVAEAGSEA